MDFLKEIVKEIGDEYTQIASDIDETERFIDTGSYIFNGLISGSIFGGVSSNRITAIAGESSPLVKLISLLLLSRTFWTLTLMGIVSILTLKQPSIKDYWSLVGIDTTRLVVVNVVTIEEFRSKALKGSRYILKDN